VAVHDGASVANRRRVVVLLALLTCAYAALASTARAKTLPALAAVMLPAAVVAAWTFRHPPPPVEPSYRLHRATLLWACLATTALLWETGALIGERTVGPYQYPTLSLLVEPALQEPVIRFGAWAVWLLAGWRLVWR
jgi:hypothetical protein